MSQQGRKFFCSGRWGKRLHLILALRCCPLVSVFCLLFVYAMLNTAPYWEAIYIYVNFKKKTNKQIQLIPYCLIFLSFHTQILTWGQWDLHYFGILSTVFVNTKDDVKTRIWLLTHKRILIRIGKYSFILKQ